MDPGDLGSHDCVRMGTVSSGEQTDRVQGQGLGLEGLGLMGMGFSNVTVPYLNHLLRLPLF